MKRGTPQHPKTIALADALDIARWGAVGVLESLWHWVGQYARQGDVGRHSNRSIAAGIGWSGDADGLIEALIEAGWLDRCRCHRLRIHDWPDHADQAVRKTTAVSREGFVACYTAGEPPEDLQRKDGGRPEGVNPQPTPGNGTGLTTHDSRPTASSKRKKLAKNGTRAEREMVDRANAIIGRPLAQWTKANIEAVVRAHKHYTPDEIVSVLVSIRDGTTATGEWCRSKLLGGLELEYMLRPGSSGAADRILTQLSTPGHRARAAPEVSAAGQAREDAIRAGILGGMLDEEPGLDGRVGRPGELLP